MAKRKNMMDMMDMTPVCEWCGKVAPVDTKLSNPNWTVYRTKEPCECGGKYTARAFLDDRVRSSCDKRPTMHDEYISREAAIGAVKHAWAKGLEPSQYIEILPDADVAEVVHGEWLRADDDWNSLTTIQCSICSEEWCFETDDDVSLLNYKYCPNCGAKMGGAAE